MIDDRWESWGIAARWNSERGWHDPVNELPGNYVTDLLKDMDDATA